MDCVIELTPEKVQLKESLRELAYKHKVYLVEFREGNINYVYSDNKEFRKEALGLLK